MNLGSEDLDKLVKFFQILAEIESQQSKDV